MLISHPPRRQATPDAHRGRSRGLHRLIAPLAGMVAAAALLLAPGLAGADTGSTLTVVGTSDVSDSGLIPNLIQPGFHAAYPQYTFKYIGTASGTAIQDAETGSVGASALIVHAASLENQFVAGGFSYEPFGRAIWTNDFVLAGPGADPAGVSASAANNIVQAFADIAAAGANGGGTPRATFVSRGGTPGTTVTEHGLWAQVDKDGLTPAGVQLCAVPNTPADPLGGGETPINPASSGLTGNDQPCPGGVLPGSLGGGALPSWYLATGDTQGPNVTAASVCNGSGGPTGVQSGANSCYVFTDRGTYDYLAAGGTPSAGASTIPGLTILTRNNSASAPGGAYALTNYFHAYIINPAKSPSPVNLTAAQAFLNYLTSPTVQAQLSSYLNDTGDPGGPPFVATASPKLTVGGYPTAAVAARQTVTLSGNVSNLEPGYPPLAGKSVSVDELAGFVPVPVATTTTDANGNYSISFVPPSSGSYQVATGQIQQIENATLSPAFGDILSPASTAATPVSVNGTAAITKYSSSAGAVQVSGTVGPGAPDANGVVTLLARGATSKGAFRAIGSATLAKGQTTYAVNGSLNGGNWTIKAQYSDAGSLNAATTGTRILTVPFHSVNVSFHKLSVKNGTLTLQGTLAQGPTVSTSAVRLYALSVGTVSVTKTTPKKSVRVIAVKASAPTFRQVAKVMVKKGKTTYTIRHTFKRGHRYVLQLKYVNKGQTTTYSVYKYLDVH